MVDEHDDGAPWPLDETLPPRALLESYTVSDLPVDFTDRVMGSLRSELSAGVTARPSRMPWVLAAVSTACAIAACVALVVTRRSPPMPTDLEPIAVVTPAVDVVPVPDEPTPLPVAAPAPARATGDLIVQAEPRDAIVRVDGVRILGASGSPFVTTNLLVGPHLVEVEREGYVTWSQRIDLPAHALPITVALERVPETTSELATPGVVGRTPRVVPRRRPKSAEGSPDLKDPFGD